MGPRIESGKPDAPIEEAKLANFKKMVAAFKAKRLSCMNFTSIYFDRQYVADLKSSICNTMQQRIITDDRAPTEKQKATKIALHRTRLRFSYQEIISVSLFFKALSPPAAAESLRLIPLTEIVERNFTFFQFCNNLKSFKLRLKC